MTHDRILAILYDISIVMGGETRVGPLITKVIQALLGHTNIPCGLFFLPGGMAQADKTPLKLEKAVGNHELNGLVGQTFYLPAELSQGPSRLIESDYFSTILKHSKTAYTHVVRLKVPDNGFFLLLSPEDPKLQLPWAQVFEPVMSNFSRILELCRVAEAHALQLRDDRQQALAKAGRFRAALDQSTNLILLVEPDTLKVVDFNQQAITLTGWGEEEIMNLAPEELIPCRQMGSWQGLLEQMRAANRHSCKETCVLLTKTGREIPVEVSFSLVLREGEGETLIATAWDISERIEYEARLNRLYQAVEQAGEGVMIVNRHGVIEYINRAFTGLTGYTRDEAIGKTPNLLKSGLQSEAYYQELWETILDGRIFQKPIRERRKGGSVFSARISIAPIRNGLGEITHFVSFLVDTSTEELMEARLRQSQKMEAIGTLVGGIAHDFNNMLTGMAGNLFLVQEANKAIPESQEPLWRLERLVNRASEMVGHLLTFSRKSQAEISPCDLSLFFREVLKLLKVGVPENIRFDAEVPKEQMVVLANATQLQQMVMNLLSNAIDAVRQVQSPLIRFAVELYKAAPDFLALHPELSGEDFVRIELSDNGMGIPEENLAKIYEPFFTTKEVGKGTGLGLAMVYSVVQMHNGLLEVETEEGQGTRFIIYLPLAAKGAFRGKAAEEETPKGKGECVLVVDDEEGVRKMMERVLEKLGYRVFVTGNGQEALDLFKKCHQDIGLVLMDIVMPQMGGAQAVAEMKKIHPGVKVIYTTGYDRSHHFTAEETENLVILQKPFTVDELGRLVRLELNREAAG